MHDATAEIVVKGLGELLATHSKARRETIAAVLARLAREPHQKELAAELLFSLLLPSKSDHNAGTEAGARIYRLLPSRSKCTCTITRHERMQDRACPVHGAAIQ